ncbi:MAG TPA: exopolysaccharide biosynthesis polyprenyl glycosylphosphotransferase [Vicinamibacterales bacterium]|jgi:exopolysaccharide biosynthesis polyprenyl glycosylphosphotransferase|nr:exopolysaccharide biosynthesis polyprenyl glycosylphosphotransferase [Acidobacteriota bacterium]HQX80720.1 exopolysaccharide biosynthesis polyprenyl glycosylphosphotransferase [Vicinamibacterales bacterium]
MARALRPSERAVLLAVSDTASATMAVVLATWTWSLTAGFGYSAGFVRDQAWWFIAVPLWVTALSPTRHSTIALDLRATASGLIHAGGVLLVAYLAVFFYVGSEALPRLVALYLLWNAAWLTLGGRLLLLWILTRDSFTRTVLIVGDGPAADAAMALAKEPALRDAAMLAPLRRADDQRLIAGEGIDGLAARLGVNEVIVAADGAVSAETIDQLLRCQEAGIDVVTFARVYEQTLRRVPVRHLGHDWMLTQLFVGAGPGDPSPIAKRLLDLAVAVILAVVGVVPAVIAALAVLVESGRPVLYSQMRQGRRGRPFRLTKFRTMRKDAETAGPQWSPENDPRITRVGRMLRRTHIDELPNLWAVLRGDMSMVGPRPERREFIDVLEQQAPLYRARLIVAPGLTGWAQVNTRYGDSVEGAMTKLEYDLYYVRHRSMWFDLSILVRTVGRMLLGRGR